jgi:hypothetical protein
VISDTQIRTDMEFLNSRPEFRRFLFRAIQTAGIFDQKGSGKSERDLAYAEGRRDQGLDLLHDAERGQPAAHPEGIPILTTIQILVEEAQQAGTEKKKDGRRNDRYRDLADGSDGDGPDDGE